MFLQLEIQALFPSFTDFCSKFQKSKARDIPISLKDEK